MAVKYEEAVQYFNLEVLHNTAWQNVDRSTRARALKNAENMLYSHFRGYNVDTKPLPLAAVCQQALYMLRQDDNIQRAEMGVANMSLGGEISMGFSQTKQPRIAPAVYEVPGMSRIRVGRTTIK